MHYTPTTIPAEAVDALWPAFERSDVLDASQWVQRCREDVAQLWREGDCWAITEVQDTRKGRAAHIVALAGTYTNTLLHEIEDWAREVGCSRIFYTGRRGWLRAQPDYKLRCVTAEKEL